MARTPDFYALLDVDPEADEDTLKKAWRKKVMANHPDRNMHDQKAAGKLGCNTYFHDDLTPIVFGGVPVVVTGLPKRIVLLDDVAIVGTKVMKRPQSALSGVEDLCRAYA